MAVVEVAGGRGVEGRVGGQGPEGLGDAEALRDDEAAAEEVELEHAGVMDVGEGGGGGRSSRRRGRGGEERAYVWEWLNYRRFQGAD